MSETMVDKEYWKERYKDKWKDGNRRESMAVELFKGWGITLVPFGFEALSEEYNKESPEEKGKPDFFAEINGETIYFEVTGTDAARVSEKADLWVRPDKAEYCEKHELKAYCVHILDTIQLIRFVKMKEVSESPIINPVIRGTRETYHSVSPIHALSIEQFKKELKINS